MSMKFLLTLFPPQVAYIFSHTFGCHGNRCHVSQMRGQRVNEGFTHTGMFIYDWPMMWTAAKISHVDECSWPARRGSTVVDPEIRVLGRRCALCVPIFFKCSYILTFHGCTGQGQVRNSTCMRWSWVSNIIQQIVKCPCAWEKNNNYIYIFLQSILGFLCWMFILSNCALCGEVGLSSRVWEFR